MVSGKVIQFRRGRHTVHKRHFLIEVPKIENREQAEKLVGKDAEKIMEILNVQKTKKAIAKKEIILKSESPDGIGVIKKVLSETGEAEVKYLAAGRYTIQIVSDDIKKASVALREILEKIEKKAKENKAEFSIKER